MGTDNNDSPERRKTVGIYDRPARADRSRARVIWIAVALAVAGALGWMLYLR